jgi:hypothetical protein
MSKACKSSAYRCRRWLSWFAGHKRHDPRTERILPVAPHLSYSKPDGPQHFGNLGPWIKLLGVGFLMPTKGVSDLAKGHDAASQLLLGNVSVEFHHAGPIFAFKKPLRESFASTGFGHVENQESLWRQGVKHPLAHSPQRLKGVIRIEEVVKHFAQRRYCSASGYPKLEARLHMECRSGNPLACKLDHCGGDVHANDLLAGISEFSCPNPAATSEVYDQALGDAVLSEQAQEARRRAAGKSAEAGVVDVGEIVLVSIGMGHV